MSKQHRHDAALRQIRIADMPTYGVDVCKNVSGNEALRNAPTKADGDHHIAKTYLLVYMNACVYLFTMMSIHMYFEKNM